MQDFENTPKIWGSKKGSKNGVKFWVVFEVVFWTKKVPNFGQISINFDNICILLQNMKKVIINDKF
jgi:hypothetical protein